MNYVLTCNPVLFELFHRTWPKGEPLTALVYRQPRSLIDFVTSHGVGVIDVEPMVADLCLKLPPDFARWMEMPGDCLGLKLALPIHLPKPFALYDDDQLVHRLPVRRTIWSRGTVLGTKFNPVFWTQIEREFGFEFDHYEYCTAHTDNGFSYFDVTFSGECFLETIQRLYKCPWFTSMPFSAWRCRSQIVCSLHCYMYKFGLLGLPHYKIVTSTKSLPKDLTRYDILHYVMGRGKEAFAREILCSLRSESTCSPAGSLEE